MLNGNRITGHFMMLLFQLWDGITLWEAITLACCFLAIVIGIVCFAIPSQRKTGVTVFSVLVGLLFIYSGFVKADDPMGFTIKLKEYFAQNALNMPYLDKFALYFAIIIPIVELILGFMILIGAYKRFTLWMLLLTILFFSFLTFYTAHYNKVLECGCFGDAIPMTPWASFGKNMVLLFLIIMLFLGSWHIVPRFSRFTQNGIIVLFTGASIAFSLYCYNYLPVIDFRPYKPGTDIKKSMQGIPDVLKYHYILKNKKTGETKEFDQFPPNWQDTWDYVSSPTDVIKKGVEPKIKDFSIVSPSGNDVTDSVLSNPNYTFLLVSSSLDEANKDPKVIQAINNLATNCLKNNINFICLTASGDDDIQKYKQMYNPPYQFYSTDGTVLKTMIRSNPGLVLIKGGIIIADWHYHSIPDYSVLNQKQTK